MEDIMVDIETLGNSPTSVILSIGAVAFDPNSNAIGEGFHTLIDIDSCLQTGLTMDGSTICWWMTQSEDARNIFNKQASALSLYSALFAFKQYCADVSDSPIVWCNGSNFDAPILDHAYRKVSLQAPWQYYNVRDYRTIKSSLNKTTFNALRVLPEIAHDAYHDALAQAKTLQNIFTLGKAVNHAVQA